MTNCIYFDMDGVLADFDLAYNRLIARRTLDGDVFWEEVQNHPTFSSDLPLMPLARDLWHVVPQDRRRILSGLPRSIDQCANHKRGWLKANGFEVGGDSIFFVRGRKNKRAYARPGDILIDDREDNILDWVRAGGVLPARPLKLGFLLSKEATDRGYADVKRACDLGFTEALPV
jgi:hypothetical protein